MTQVAFRLPADVIHRIDSHVERMTRQTPGLAPTRSDAVRVLLIQALDAAERADDNRS